MTAITLRGLWTRKLRAGLTALAVLLGVMMISGTYVFTDTINHSFDRIFETANKGVDIKVVPHKTVDSQEVPVPPFSESLLGAGQVGARASRRPAGGVNDSATVFDKNGKRANKGRRAGADVLRLAGALQPAHLRRGAPAGERERGDARHEHRRQARTSRSATRVLGRGQAPGEALPDLGARQVRRRVRVRRRDDRGPHPARGAADQPRSAASSTRSTSPSPRARAPKQVDGASCAACCRGRSTSRPAPRTRKDQADDIHSGLSFLNTLLLAFAGHRAVRRRVHHLQHVLDHGRAAHDRVRAAAHDGRLAAADPALGHARGAASSGWAPRSSGLFAGILTAKGISALFKAFSIDLPSQGTVLLAAHGDRLAAGRHDRDRDRRPRARAARDPRAAARGPARRTSCPRGRAGRRRTVIAIVLTGFGVAAARARPVRRAAAPAACSA